MADETSGKRKRKSVVTDSAKKRRKQKYNLAFDKARVHIGKEFARWRQLKTTLTVKSDAKLAKILLDRFEDYALKQSLTSTAGPSHQQASNAPGPSQDYVHSTPGPSQGLLNPPVSEISSASEIGGSERYQPEMSGVESIQSEDSDPGWSKMKSTGSSALTTKTGRLIGQKKLTSSFADPFDLSIDITLQESSYEDSDDPDYEPSFILSANLPDYIDEDIEEMAFEEIEFGLEVDTNTIDEEDAEELSGVTKVTTDNQCDEICSQTMCLAFLPQLKLLADISVSNCSTSGCKEPVKLTESFVSSALYFKWICGNGHVTKEWCSQPLLNKRLHSGDFLVCGSILTSGNNYGKLCLWAKMLNLKFPSSDQFHRIQSTYLVPTIDQYWQEHQLEQVTAFRGQQVVVLGDGRNDSPGHSSQYCSYTLMEESTKTILTIKTLDKRVTDRKSVNMEKVGFERGMSELKDQHVEVTEVVTDAHLGIGAIMKSRYPDIKHSHDIWHAAKNLGKKIVKVAQKKQNSVLMKWSKDIVNHFWFACKEANTSSQFVSIWRSVLHHITNTHEWMLPDGNGQTRCLHEPLTVDEERDKPWLDPSKDAAVLKDLASVVLDKRLLKKVDYYLNFRSTADLEGFHQLILMYCSKRFSYSPPVYRARNILAALDHNMNIGRDEIVNRDGTQRLQRLWNKKSGRWTAHAKKVPKSYDHVRDILSRSLKTRIHDKTGMRKKKELEADDPRRISKHLAPEEPKPTKEIMEEKVSRFK